MTPPDALMNFVDDWKRTKGFKMTIELYADVIVKMHDVKGASFREIVEFLDENGVKANRSTVHRIYQAAKVQTVRRRRKVG